MKTDYELLQEVISLSSEKNNNKKLPTDTYFSSMCQHILNIMKQENIYFINELKDTKYTGNMFKNMFKNIKEHLDLILKGRFVNYFSRVSIKDGKCCYNLFYPNKKKYLRDNIFTNVMSVQGKTWGPTLYNNPHIVRGPEG